MDEHNFNKFIAYAFGLIIAHYVLNILIDYLIYGVVGLVIFRIAMEYQRRK